MGIVGFSVVGAQPILQTKTQDILASAGLILTIL